MAKDFFGRLEETISTTGKAAAQKAKEVADSATVSYTHLTLPTIA